MRRRALILLIGGTLAAWPLSASSQQRSTPTVGWLGSTSDQPVHVVPFLRGLQDEGYVEGQNATVQFRWADGRYDRLPDFAAQFVNQPVNVIVAQTSAAARAAKAVTGTIPTVFSSGSDPVRLGFVASMNRPGGNRTG